MNKLIPAIRTPQAVVHTQTPMEASLDALDTDMANAGIGEDECTILTRGSEVELYVMSSDVASKLVAIFDAAGFRSRSEPDPYTGYDKTVRVDTNGISYSIVRDQMGGVTPPSPDHFDEGGGAA